MQGRSRAIPFALVALAALFSGRAFAADDPRDLVEAFRTGDDRERAAAIEKLYTLGDAGQPFLKTEVERLLELIRTGDVETREDALTRLSDVGPAARPALEAALRGSDPDLRFHALHVLQAPAGRLKRLVRLVVEGVPINAASFAEAKEAYESLRELAKAPTTARSLVRLAHRQARGGSRARWRYVVFCLSMVRDLVERNAEQATPGLALDMARLLEFDLRVGHHELISAFAALPIELTLQALDASLSGGSPWVRARAARVLAEALPANRSADAAHRIAPLFKHPNPQVRLAAVRAIGLLALPSQALIPIVPLVRDRDPLIAGEALTLAGFRRLEVVREGAETLAANLNTPAQLRRRAVLALGMLKPGSVQLLRRLASPQASDRRLAALAAWAMGASRAPGALEAIEKLLAVDGFAAQGLLYRGLGRLGGAQGLAALQKTLSFEPGARSQRARRVLAVQALGYLRDAPGAADLLGDLARKRPVQRLGEQGPTGPEITAAVNALAERADDESLIRLARILIARGGSNVKLPVDLIARVGGPRGEPQLKIELARALEQIVRHDNSLFVVGSAATALAKVDPLRAQTVLRRALDRGQHPRTGREFARALARAGDRTQIEAYALSYSRAEVERADAADRADLMNNVGIDLLYAGRLAEALFEFRRMLWCRPSDQIASYNVACGYALAGQVEPALRSLRRSVSLDYGNHRHLVYDTDLNVLHGDPRFELLVEQLRVFEETGITSAKVTWPGAGGR